MASRRCSRTAGSCCARTTRASRTRSRASSRRRCSTLSSAGRGSWRTPSSTPLAVQPAERHFEEQPFCRWQEALAVATGLILHLDVNRQALALPQLPDEGHHDLHFPIENRELFVQALDAERPCGRVCGLANTEPFGAHNGDLGWIVALRRRRAIDMQALGQPEAHVQVGRLHELQLFGAKHRRYAYAGGVDICV